MTITYEKHFVLYSLFFVFLVIIYIQLFIYLLSTVPSTSDSFKNHWSNRTISYLLITKNKTIKTKIMNSR
jgi:hypothetical protein